MERLRRAERTDKATPLPDAFRVKANWGRRTWGGLVYMVDRQSGPAAVVHTTTPVITGNLYETAFSSTGQHPRCGVAIASTEQEAQQHLAFMLFI